MPRLRAIAIVGGIIAALALIAGLAVGSHGFFHGPALNTTLSIEDNEVSVPAEPIPSIEPAPCWEEVSPAQVKYDIEAAATRSFGNTLAPAALPLVRPESYTPSREIVMETVCNEWRALRTRPAQTSATAHVALPEHRDYYGDSQVSQLGMLSSQGDWNKANLTFVDSKSPPPFKYTMGMDYHLGEASASPTVFLIHARTTGWYLTVPFLNGYTLYLRVACGGQPNFTHNPNMQDSRYLALQNYPTG
jgi:hypothetical protein